MVLTEIMFDPIDNESTDEFIELYNETSQAVTIDGWRITDGGDTDRIVELNGHEYVMPHQYVVILDPDYFEDGSTAYDGMIPENALIMTIDNATFGDRGLSNSNAECISIVNAEGVVVASYTYSIENSSGRSDEKIDPQRGDSSANWANSLVENGTPGSRNSVTPPDHDLTVSGFKWDQIGLESRDSINVWISVRNIGLLPSIDSLFLLEQVSDSERLLQSWQGWMLNPDDSIQFYAMLRLTNQSPRRLIAKLSGSDERDDNDIRVMTIFTEEQTSAIVINEIMYASEPQRSEWVELHNTAPYSMSMRGWSFGDGTAIHDSTRRFILPDTVVAPSGFVVLSSDSSIYFDNIPVEIPVFVWGSRPISLNNTGDSLILFDDHGEFADRVDYRPSWGDRTVGISLERISTLSASNDHLNWAASLDSTGGTPGRVNSRALPSYAAGRELLVLEPNPFTPDGDNRDDIMAIRYHLDYPDARLDLKIYDVRGREVRRLANNEPAGYIGEKLWDGRSSDGRLLPTGQYIVYLEALGKGGSRIQSAQRVAVLARRS